MTIWRLHDPDDTRYASARRRGTWHPKKMGVCPECTASRQKRVQPLIIEWELGSDVVGDFVRPGFDDEAIVTERVMNSLMGRFSGFEPGPVEMIQARSLKRPKRVTKRTKPRIWLPYEGPPLYDVWVTALVPQDKRWSTLEDCRECHTCGRADYTVAGIEQWESDWNQETHEYRRWLVPRKPGHGIFVRERDLQGADVFRVEEDGWILSTDRVKDFVEREGFTNVGFLETGEVIQG